MRTNRFLIAAMIVFAPLAFFALLSAPNEYQAMGIDGAVDCDGPLTVLLFALPSLAVYTMGFISFARTGRANRKAGSTAVAAICLLVCILLAGNIAMALQARSNADHRESCGSGL